MNIVIKLVLVCVFVSFCRGASAASVPQAVKTPSVDSSINSVDSIDSLPMPNDLSIYPSYELLFKIGNEKIKVLVSMDELCALNRIVFRVNTTERFLNIFVNNKACIDVLKPFLDKYHRFEFGAVVEPMIKSSKKLLNSLSGSQHIEMKCAIKRAVATDEELKKTLALKPSLKKSKKKAKVPEVVIATNKSSAPKEETVSPGLVLPMDKVSGLKQSAPLTATERPVKRKMADAISVSRYELSGINIEVDGVKCSVSLMVGIDQLRLLESMRAYIDAEQNGLSFVLALKPDCTNYISSISSVNPEDYIRIHPDKIRLEEDELVRLVRAAANCLLISQETDLLLVEARKKVLAAEAKAKKYIVTATEVLEEATSKREGILAIVGAVEAIKNALEAAQKAKVADTVEEAIIAGSLGESSWNKAKEAVAGGAGGAGSSQETVDAGVATIEIVLRVKQAIDLLVVAAMSVTESKRLVAKEVSIMSVAEPKRLVAKVNKEVSSQRDVESQKLASVAEVATEASSTEPVVHPSSVALSKASSTSGAISNKNLMASGGALSITALVLAVATLKVFGFNISQVMRPCLDKRLAPAKASKIKKIRLLLAGLGLITVAGLATAAVGGCKWHGESVGAS